MTRCSTALRSRLVTLLAAVVACSTVAVLATVAPAEAATFSNASALTIADATCSVGPGKANLYPSDISVSGLTGTVSDVNVTLRGMTHPFEGDFEILLVGPGGGVHNLVLLSDAGTGALSNATLTLDDQAASQLPQNSAWASTTAKPTDYAELVLGTNPADTYPGAPSPVNSPAPTGSATLASSFNGIAPNGTWSLYVLDDACGDSGSISGGWSLDITTSSGAATTTVVTSTNNPSTTGQNVTFTAAVTSGGNPVTTGTVTFTEGATVLAANVAVNAGGQATFATSTIPEGNHTITATYNGTAAFATSNGTVNERVNNATTVTGNQYCNTGPITVNPLPNPATPYPSNINVTGGPANLGKVTVTLKNVTHPFADDIDVLLVSPTGQNLVVVSDAGTATSNVTATFDDAAAGQLAQSAPWGAPNSSVTSKPVDYDPAGQVDVFPAPAPAPSAATTLATFNGTNSNGTWSLYVVSDGAPDSGTIAGGWCLSLTAAKATPTIATTATGTATIGGAVSDTATVTGSPSPATAPTGTVIFTAFGPNNTACTGTPAFTSAPQSLAGGPPPTAGSGSFTPAAPGTYRWVAAYGGDANYVAVTSLCNATNESTVVNQATATMATMAVTPVSIGASITDTATVTGAASPAPTPTGTVTFTLFGPGNATCTGAPVFTSAARSLTGGPPPTATSAAFTPTALGSYNWVAVYSGDANYPSLTSACGAANETSVVNQATAGITTSAVTPVTIGGSIADSATVTGATGAPVPTGTVTFTAFGPANPTCTGAAIFTSAAQPLAGGPPRTASSGPFSPTAPGSYNWVAAYSGDANYPALTSACGAANETSVVNRATAVITTAAVTPITIGGPISDSATVTGAGAPAPAPTGTVIFTLFGPANPPCTGAAIFTSAPRPLAGGPPSTATSGPFSPPAVGSYNWVAVYSGDANYPPVTSACGSANETSVVNQATAVITTAAVTPITIGGPISDTATVAGAPGPAPVPTGSVSFTLFGPANPACTGAAIFTSPAQPLAGGPPPTATSPPFTPTAVGSYNWVAVYSGDANYPSVTSPCGAANETSTVTKAAPTLVTTASAGGVVGTPVHDTGVLAGGIAPTGTITFALFGPADTTCAGPAVFTPAAVPVAGNGSYDSPSFIAPAPGTYRWTATYGGDAKNNAAASACNAANESVVISKASPTLVTTASAGGPLGTQVHDTAVLAGGFGATGSITFNLYGPNDATCTGQVASTSTVTVAGNGSYNSANFLPSAPGTYRWTATYSGDAANNAAPSACNAVNESVLVDKASPTLVTNASAGGVIGVSVHDAAVLAGGSTPTGSVVFNLYGPNDATCTGPVASTSTVTVAGNGSYDSASFTPALAGTYRWTASYAGDANNNAVSSACNAANESVVVSKATPTVATQASAGNLLGAPVSDTATVSGGASPTGTVTFRLYSDAGCGTPVFTATTALSGSTAGSGNFTPAAAGTYFWTALYNGDVNNNAVLSGCGAPNESVVIQPFSPPPFTQTVTGDYTGPLTVAAGQSVLITNARVVGPVTVQSGGALTVMNSQISRGITANAPSFFSLCGTQVSAPSPGAALTVSNAPVPIRIGDPASGCAGNRFAGSVAVTSNLAVTFGANIVSQGATIDTNGPGGTVIKANNVNLTLACSGNNPPPTNAGMANTAGSKTGQCAAL